MQPGLQDLLAQHPEVEIYVAAIDDELTEVRPTFVTLLWCLRS
jgi:uracil phosphoribosyltransferase